MNGLGSLLSAKGRINRLDYFLRSLATLLLSLFNAPITIDFATPEIVRLERFEFQNPFGWDLFSNLNIYHLEEVLAPYAIPILVLQSLLIVLIIWFLAVSLIKRLHDNNLTGWLCLLMLIPVVNFIMWFVMIISEGSRGANRFGPPPSHV